MNGRCTSTRMLAALAGLAAVVGTSVPAIAQNAIVSNSMSHQPKESDLQDPATFHTLQDAIDAGVVSNMQNPEGDGNFGTARGGPAECTQPTECDQPFDDQNGLNMAVNSTAELRTFPNAGTLNEICVTIIPLGGGCPASTDDPIFQDNWNVNIYNVDSTGDILESTVQTFSNEDGFSSLIVNTASAGVVLGGNFSAYDAQFTLVGGVTVDAGDCLAIQPQPLNFGIGSQLSSSDPIDGTATGDGFTASDNTATNNWTNCEFSDFDLQICLNLDSIAPLCAPQFDNNPPANDECDTPKVLACGSVDNQCLKFATTNTMTDPVLDDCEVSGLPDGDQGLSSVWYSVTPTDSRLLLDLRNTDGDPNLLMSAYRVGDTPGEGEGPCNLVLVSCRDDNGSDNPNGGSPFLCLNNVTPGEELIIEVVAIGSFSQTTTNLEVTCDPLLIPDPPVNDDLANAIAVDFDGNMQTTFSGTTFCGSADPLATACNGVTPGSSPGVWYTAVGDGTTWIINNCGDIGSGSGDFDSQISVYCGM